jgi:hypothetical protein
VWCGDRPTSVGGTAEGSAGGRGVGAMVLAAKEQGAGSMAMGAKEQGAGSMAMVAKEQGAGSMVLAAKEQGAGSMAMAAKEQGAGSMVMGAKEQGAGSMAMAAKEQGAGSMVMGAKEQGAGSMAMAASVARRAGRRGEGLTAPAGVGGADAPPEEGLMRRRTNMSPPRVIVETRAHPPSCIPGFGKPPRNAEPRREQDWFLKGLQAGQAFPPPLLHIVSLVCESGERGWHGGDGSWPSRGTRPTLSRRACSSFM